mmetsp:Transcript_36312/g.76250  ORF Transcript_36312/g.76250 Transcript_36312/m.76250 type:complete len:159 (+) Transcript_36312:675-1151(+)
MGAAVGVAVGLLTGASVGFAVGLLTGAAVGTAVGMPVGLALGKALNEGASDGGGVPTTTGDLVFFADFSPFSALVALSPFPDFSPLAAFPPLGAMVRAPKKASRKLFDELWRSREEDLERSPESFPRTHCGSDVVAIATNTTPTKALVDFLKVGIAKG